MGGSPSSVIVPSESMRNGWPRICKWISLGIVKNPDTQYSNSLRPGITPKLDALQTLYEGKKIIVGRDKLDVVKGVMQKVGKIEYRNKHADRTL